MAGLSAKARARGVVASSAGNHAQGVALSAKRLGLKAIIVMPSNTPDIKVQAVKNLGGKTILHGENYDAAYEYARQLEKEKGYTFIHPFDDPEVIAGQGTVGMEILHQHRGKLDTIFVPIGGGGLIAGIAAYVKYVRPEVRIVGVEPEDAPSMYEALKQNKRVKLKHIGLFADGVAVRQVGKETFRIARECVDDMVLVSTDEICGAIRDIFEDTRSIAEPAGALATAGMKKYLAEKGVKGQRHVALFCGANMNFSRLQHIAERTELGNQREALLAVTIPERPGSFIRFCKHLGQREISEFNYRYADNGQAHIFVGVKLARGQVEKDELIAKLSKLDYPVVDLTNNEMAKLHVRHMVGGHAPQAENEMVFRVELPERAGALLKFLTDLGQKQNISLFHYRNHAADFGRVLVGLQVPKGERKSCLAHLNKLGYVYQEETNNPVYQFFLA